MAKYHVPVLITLMAAAAAAEAGKRQPMRWWGPYRARRLKNAFEAETGPVRQRLPVPDALYKKQGQGRTRVRGE